MTTTPTKRPLTATAPYSPLDHKTVLGSGSYGSALLGRHPSTGTPLVFKAQRRTTQHQKEVAAREAKVTKLVTEKGIPHCVHYRDSYDSTLKNKSVKVLVTNHAPGQTLDKIINEDDHGHLLQCVTITKQLIECLRSLMEEKLAHFDLKPENVIYDRKSRQVRVIDFGGAIKHDEMPLENLIITPIYASPENLLGNPVEDDKCSSDIWSVGCILFELYTGKRLISSIPQPPLPDARLTPQEKKDQVTFHRNNHILQQIAALIGMPSPDFLRTCPSARKYFTKDLQHFKQPIPEIKPRDWKAEIHTVIEENSEKLGYPFNEEEFSEITAALNAMLKYPDARAEPEELLEYELFQDDISFGLVFGSYANRKLPIQMKIFPDDIAEDEELKSLDAVQLDLNNSLDSTCFHLGRDSANKYWVTLESNGEIVKEQFILPDNQYAIDIAPLIDSLLNPATPDAEPKRARKDLRQKFEDEKENATSLVNETGLVLVPESSSPVDPAPSLSLRVPNSFRVSAFLAQSKDQ